MGYRPEAGKTDDKGYEIADREYNIKDFDRTLVLDQRTKAVAAKVTEFLKKTDRMSKTIVFCVDVEHAERMRQALINENKDLYKENNRYIMRITGDNQEGKEQLGNFIDEDSDYPVIAVTSRLMTTGVDAKMCRLIVLDNNFSDEHGMTEFKQIIGRGTRLLEEKGKTYFTIMDFRNASRLFADKDFDGTPDVVIDIPDGGEMVDPPVNPVDSLSEMENDEPIQDVQNIPGTSLLVTQPDGDMPKKYYVSDVEVTVISERVQYIDKDGKLITESLIDYTRKNILSQYARLDDFLSRWTKAQRKQAIIDELKEEGVLLDAVREETGKTDIDDFDLICHLAYDKAPLTRLERANSVRKRGYLYRYAELAQKVLGTLLDKYADEGIKDIEDTKVLQLKEFAEYGSPMKIAKAFGGKEGYQQAVRELENEIFSA